MVLSASPVLDASATPSLGTITEAAAPVGAVGILVSELIDAAGPLRNFSDADGDLPGIAITAVNLQGGRLWYSVDAGAQWRELAPVSDVFATLLWADGDTRLHVTANGEFFGAISDVITFRAWDRTGGFANGATGINTQIDDPFVGFWDTAGTAAGVVISPDGRYAYVADGSAGLQVIDVRDPTALVRVGGFNTSGSSQSVAVSSDGRHAYVADGSAGLQVIDVRDPAAPVRVGGYNTSGSAVGVTLSPSGRYAYVADSATGLQVIDVLNPAAPAWAGGYDTSGSAVGVTLSPDGRYAYLADDDAGLQVIDVLNPVSLVRVGGYDTSGFAVGVTLSADGRHAYVADFDAGLQVIDVLNPAAPVRVGQCATSGLAASAITLSPDGLRAYVADDVAGLQLVDVSDPAAPVVVGRYDTTGTAVGVTLSGNGRYAYVANDTAGLQVIDVRTPASVSVVGTSDTNGVPSKLALAPLGRYAYVANSTGNLQVIDVLDPAAPVSVGGCDTLGFAFGVAIAPDGRHAYVADFDAGLRVIDIRNPAAPVVVGGYDTSGFSRGVAISPDGRYAYVADDAAGLHVIDVLDPAAPVRVGGYDTSGFTVGVTLSSDGRYAYLADDDAGLQVIDVIDPAAPQRVGGHDTSGFASGVTLSLDGRYAYVVDQSAGLQVIAATIGRPHFSTGRASVAAFVSKRPTAVALSTSTIGENMPVGTVVGSLSTTDPDTDDRFTYTLVPGPGSPDNASFRIDGATLTTASAFNFESKNRYSIRVRSTDRGGQSVEGTFTIQVADLANEPLVVESITPPSPGSYKAGETARFLVGLSETATVTGRPMLELRAGAAIRKAAYVSGSGTSSLAFEYVVGTKDSAEQVSVGARLFLSKTITIAAGAAPLPAALPVPVAAAVASGVRFDTVSPKAVGRVQPPPNGSYVAGRTLDFVVTFSENVYVTGPGIPRIAINGMTGGPRQAAYVSGAGTSQLTFRYVVQAGDAVAGKQGLSLAKSITADGGTITDRDGKNPAALGIKVPKLSGIVLAEGSSPFLARRRGRSPGHTNGRTR